MGVLYDMNVIDIIILLPIFYGLIRGLMRGFVQELTNLVALIAAIIGTKLFAPAFALWLAKYISASPSVCQLLAWFILFTAIVLTLHLIGKLISRFLKAISLGWLNRLIGAIFGAAKWALIVSIVLNGVSLLDNQFHFLKPELQEQSIAYEPIQKIASVTWSTVQNEFQQ